MRKNGVWLCNCSSLSQIFSKYRARFLKAHFWKKRFLITLMKYLKNLIFLNNLLKFVFVFKEIYECNRRCCIARIFDISLCTKHTKFLKYGLEVKYSFSYYHTFLICSVIFKHVCNAFTQNLCKIYSAVYWKEWSVNTL